MKLNKIVIKLLLGLFTMSCNLSESRISKIAENHPILGEWEVKRAGITPFNLDSFCNGLDIGTIIKFNKKNDIFIYKAEKFPCNKGQEYWIDTLNNLVIFEYDVGIDLRIEYIDNDLMTLSSDAFWPGFIDEQVINDSFLLNGIKEMGNRIILKKIKKGG